MTAPAPNRCAPVTPLHLALLLGEIDLAVAERAAADFLNALREDPRSRAKCLSLTTPTPSTATGGRHG